MEKINIIVAMTKGMVVGKDGKLIWHLKEDMKLFKEKTEGNVVIMGRKTWDSIPEKFRPLPNRENIILSRNLVGTKGAIVCNSIEEALTKAKEFDKEIFCIGGATIYGEFLPLAKVLHISWVKKDYEGETKFPEIDFDEWNCVEEKDFEEFTYKKYERKI